MTIKAMSPEENLKLSETKHVEAEAAVQAASERFYADSTDANRAAVKAAKAKLEDCALDLESAKRKLEQAERDRKAAARAARETRVAAIDQNLDAAAAAGDALFNEAGQGVLAVVATLGELQKLYNSQHDLKLERERIRGELGLQPEPVVGVAQVHQFQLREAVMKITGQMGSGDPRLPFVDMLVPANPRVW